MDRRSESDLQEALVSGDTTRVLNVEDGGRGRTIEGDHMQLHGPLKSIVQPIALQCGLLGCRVGASNPGPEQTRSAKLRTTQLDSDPEQVVPGRRCALCHEAVARMMDPQFECRGGTSQWIVCTDQAVFGDTVRKRLRLSQASTIIALFLRVWWMRGRGI